MAFSYIFISSMTQEIVFRGGIQSYLQFFLQGKYRTVLAILTTSVMFGMMHLVFSTRLALSIIFLSIFWGWMFARQKTLMGVVLSHMLIGTWAFFILGIQQFLMDV